MVCTRHVSGLKPRLIVTTKQNLCLCGVYDRRLTSFACIPVQARKLASQVEESSHAGPGHEYSANGQEMAACCRNASLRQLHLKKEYHALSFV
jgi:hypothetical protein